jgi:hypothetical protein
MNSQHFRRYDELETARAHIEDAVRIADLNLPLDNWTSALVHAERGYVLLAQNDVDAGRAELEAAEATLADTFGADDPRASRIREALAELP